MSLLSILELNHPDAGSKGLRHSNIQPINGKAITSSQCEMCPSENFPKDTTAVSRKTESRASTLISDNVGCIEIGEGNHIRIPLNTVHTGVT